MRIIPRCMMQLRKVRRQGLQRCLDKKKNQLKTCFNESNNRNFVMLKEDGEDKSI